MALIQVKSTDETVAPIQQEEIMNRLTNATVPVLGEQVRSAAWFSMDELCNGEWSFGGNETE
jgi:phenylpyruvate tautomerase PptA (4-oxalocrotonate tautomerase family)